MSKQKYYVKLKDELQATGVTLADARLFLDKNGTFDYEYLAHAFTKSELAEIKDGAFYHVINEEWECGGGVYEPREYTNQLIELVPVEDK